MKAKCAVRSLVLAILAGGLGACASGPRAVPVERIVLPTAAATRTQAAASATTVQIDRAAASAKQQVDVAKRLAQRTAAIAARAASVPPPAPGANEPARPPTITLTPAEVQDIAADAQAALKLAEDQSAALAEARSKAVETVAEATATKAQILAAQVKTNAQADKLSLALGEVQKQRERANAWRSRFWKILLIGVPVGIGAGAVLWILFGATIRAALFAAKTAAKL